MATSIPYPLELHTQRLLIRSPEEADASEFEHALAESIETLRPWLAWAQSIPTLDEARESCRQARARFEQNEDHRLHLYLKDAFLQGTRTLVGCSGLHRIDWSVPKGEIGYWVRASYTSKGYITEAVQEITRFAIEDLGMKRVEIRMNTANHKSRHIAERLGFTHEGTLRNDMRHTDGSLRDTHIYARTSTFRPLTQPTNASPNQRS
ncbi:MAG: GNAT family N-acetyltransferase [Bacteroidota bacterium]